MKGDFQDVLSRLWSEMPEGWYEQGAELVNALLAGYAELGSFLYSQKTYVELQTRIHTATDDNLDLISKDYLGDYLPRRKDEDDISYRNRILANLLPFPSTRQGISDAVYLLTGRHPIIFEPWNINDSGALDVDFFLDITPLGSDPYSYEATFFITVFRPIAQAHDYPALDVDSFLDVDGYLWSPEMIGRQVTDDDIYNLIARVKAAGVTALVEILD